MSETDGINFEQNRRGNPAWQPGVSGNPAGRPRGARNKSTVLMEAMLEGDLEGIARSAIALAKAGDPRAIRMCMDRLCPPRRHRHVAFDLPPIACAADAGPAFAALAAAVADGTLAPAEAASLAQLVESAARAMPAGEGSPP